MHNSNAGSPKTYRRGTHRSRSASDTVAHVQRIAPALGITRVANVTGLDVIGIPVVMVCRPNARSLAVSQGKGITLDAAKASGLMESIELYHAERIALPLRRASLEELRYTERVADVSGLPLREAGSCDDYTRMLWVQAADLRTGHTAWLPFDLVDLDTTAQGSGDGPFASSSKGLASGNDWWEAVSHGVCEIIERHAQVAFDLAPADFRHARRVRLATVNDDDCVQLLERCHDAGVEVLAWETTGATNVPSFQCAIRGGSDTQRERALGIHYGMGCHPAREIAFSRALTEAAQSRLTFISGARDDMWRDAYARASDPERRSREWSRLVEDTEQRAFTDAQSWESDDIEQDVHWLLAQLSDAGLDDVLVLDHSVPAFGVTVVHVVIPAIGAAAFARPAIAAP